MEFLDNLLDYVDNPSYKITFYMVSESDIYSNNFANPSKKIIVASSGETSQLTIDDLEVISNPSPNRENKNTETREFRFSINEFYGANLMDRIYAASVELGIKNYTVTPYVMEVQFTGRNVDSSSPITDLSELRWVWPIAIRKVESNVTSSGATYAFTGYDFSLAAERLNVGRIEKATKIRARTVGEAVDKLFEKLNDHAREKAISAVTLYDTFEATVHPDVAKLTLVSDEPTVDASRTYIPPFLLDQGDEVSREDAPPFMMDDKTIEIESGVSITAAINRIVTASIKYQELSRNTQNASSLDSKNANENKRIHKIRPDITLNGFDYSRGDYRKNITYDIVPYEMPAITSSQSDVTADGNIKYNNLKTRGMIRKRYDYIFTGLNDKVIDFDMSFDMAWQVYLPSQAGNFTQYTDSTNAQFITNKFRKMRDIRRQISELRNAPPVIIEPMTEDEIRENIESANELSEEEKQQLENLLNVALDRRIEDDEEEFTSSAPSVSYLEDYNQIDVSDDMAYRKFPIRYAETSRLHGENHWTHGIESSKGAGRPLVNSLFEQAFSHNSNAFVSCELEVRGDPYWLYSKGFGLEPTGVMDSRTSQPCILFSVQQPQLWDDTGVTRFTTSNFSGVFLVREVVSSFSNGKFTQKLIMNREPFIDASEIDDIKDIE